MNETTPQNCQPPAPVSAPVIALPPRSCDAHAHIFGPGETFPYASDRSYTPPDAPLAAYLEMLSRLGCERGVVVQGSAHGTDNSAMLDALKRHPDKLRGVAVAAKGTTHDQLARWASLGVRGLRFNHFFRDGRFYYRGGIGLDVAHELEQMRWRILDFMCSFGST